MTSGFMINAQALSHLGGLIFSKQELLLFHAFGYSICMLYELSFITPIKQMSRV